MEHGGMNLISENILDLLHYKETENIRKFIKNRNHSNLILYGPPRCGKSLIIRELFKSLYGDISIIEDNNKLKAFGNLSYYYIYSNMIYDKEYFKNFINNLIQSYDYYTDKIKYIIIDNFEDVNVIIQRFLKVILEKSYKTTRFILITKRLNSIDVAINSRCTLIRIKMPKTIDKKIYLMNIFNKNGIIFNEFLLEKDCAKYNLETLIFKYQSNGVYEDIYYTYKDKILELIIMNDFNILNIRALSSTIKEININLNELLKLLLISLVKLFKNNNEKVFLLIKEIAKYNHILEGSYRDIIYIELIIISIFKIINT
uniref:ATPase AAA-type core domain-containing protein n=1 Tax=viral metagenome TaxID=1070528 RepID=A0A6C0F7I4_9ZZZZ|tara:strand:- start:4272 stop:5216 length:945 start_codon:yes stop_codon:yes gene_type:complete